MNDPLCECTAILLQDIGATGPEGPTVLRQVLGENHKILTHFSMTNKSRTVALIIHKSWEVRATYRDKTGSALAALITFGSLSIVVISAYLPTLIENYGVPTV